MIWKVTRPTYSIMCFLAAWFMATLSQAPADLRLLVSVTAALSCLGSSVFHYGANGRIYSRKEERVEIAHPWLLKLLGAGALIASIGTAIATRNLACVEITAANAIAIWLYAGTLSKHWATKNLVIAAICTTPAIMGWLVGTHTHPATRGLMTAIFLTYLAREVIKDVIDIKANHGIRVTLPMVLGVSGALVIAGLETVGGAIVTFMLAPYFWSATFAGGILLAVALQLLVTREPRKAQRAITFGMAVLMLSFI